MTKVDFYGKIHVAKLKLKGYKKMIYMILANGFEEIEAIEPLDILRRGGVDIKTVSISDTKTVNGSHSIKISADITLEELCLDDMEMVILPGGMGHELLDASNDVHAILNYAVAHKKYIAAICASPSILGKKMILSGKKATCYPGFEKYCYDAVITKDKAIRDGLIITGRGPGAAADFGFMLLEILKDKKTAQSLMMDMQYE